MHGSIRNSATQIEVSLRKHRVSYLDLKQTLAMFSRNLSVVEKEEFLRKAREKRELRDEEKKRSVAAVKIQVCLVHILKF